MARARGDAGGEDRQPDDRQRARCGSCGEKLLRVHRDAPAPDFAGRRFSRWARKHESPTTGRKVVYFHGCGTEYYEPEEGEKLVAILEHNGFEVEVPKQDCCGLPLQSSGLFDDARKVVLRLARNLAPHVRDDDTIIVGNATSCTLMLKREAREILDLEDDPDLKLVSERTYDICELLLELHDRGELKTDFQPVQDTIAYHAPCQQQGHWIGKPALELLALIPGLQVTEMNARCCGIAGTYGLKAEKYDIAMAVGADLFEQVRASGAATVACDSETCRWQIAKATERPAVHPIDLLHRAYGLVGLGDGRPRRRLPQRGARRGRRALAREMGGEELELEAAGGMDEPGALGTDAERVRAAIERAMSDDGVLVLMDLGSALMSTEFAIEMLEGGGRVLMSERRSSRARWPRRWPRAAAHARGGGRRGARRAGHEGVAARRRGPPAAPAPTRRPTAPADAEARLEVRNAIGLHARPAALFVGGRARLRRRGPRGQGGRRRARARDEPDQRRRARRALRATRWWSPRRGRRPPRR